VLLRLSLAPQTNPDRSDGNNNNNSIKTLGNKLLKQQQQQQQQQAKNARILSQTQAKKT